MVMRFVVFCAVSAVLIYFFGNHFTRWIKSMVKAADRKENDGWEKFDKKLNPPVKKKMGPTSQKKKAKKKKASK